MTTTRDAQRRLEDVERRALVLSGAAALLAAVIGVVWGLAARSQIVLFDGLYALIGLGLAWLGLRAAAAIAAGPTEHYPFGREALGPLVVGVQGLVLLGALGYGGLDAILVIRSGGSEALPGAALLYGVVTFVLAAVLWRVLRRMHPDSELVAAEATQWAAGALLSLAMVVGFGVALLLERGGREEAAAFMDPVLVLGASVALSPAPLRMLRTTFRELLEGRPGREVTDPIEEAVEAVRSASGLPRPTTRIGKLGRKVYVELDFLVPEGAFTVADADRVRRELLDRLHRPSQLLWLNVELHTDPHWDR